MNTDKGTPSEPDSERERFLSTLRHVATLQPDPRLAIDAVMTAYDYTRGATLPKTPEPPSLLLHDLRAAFVTLLDGIPYADPDCMKVAEIAIGSIDGALASRATEPPSLTVAWLTERRDNCLRLAKEKTGEDRAGWLDDARHFSSAIEALASRAEPPVSPLPVDLTERSGEAVQRAVDGEPIAIQLHEQIDHLRANLRSVVDAYEALLDDGEFPAPRNRSADEKESIAAWWEDSYARVKRAREALDHPDNTPQHGERGNK